MKALNILLSWGLVATGLVVMGSVDSVSWATDVPDCAPAQLKVTMGVPEGAAGTIFYPIVIADRGRSCALWGVPAVQPVRDGPGHGRVPVGPAARNTSIGEMPARHVLTTGHSVSDGLGVAETGNYPTRACRARTARVIVVRLSPFVKPTALPLTISVCTKLASVSTQLIVSGNTGA